MNDIKDIHDLLRDKNKSDVSINEILPGSIELAEFYNKTLYGDYASGGVVMHGSTSGKINLIGIPEDVTIEDAYLYWLVGRGSNLDPISTGKLNDKLVDGVKAIASPRHDYFNWNWDVFRANVKDKMNLYEENNLTDFPYEYSGGWQYNTYGASLVVIYSKNNIKLKTVIINDGGQAFADQIASTELKNFHASALKVNAKTTYIVVDGDAGYEDYAIFNDHILRGPDAFCLLWDNITEDVSEYVNPGSQKAIVKIDCPKDFLIYVAQVFSVTEQETPEPSRGLVFS